MAVPNALTVPAAKIDAHLQATLDGYRQDWANFDPMLSDTVDLLSTLVLAGGKRVRPAMAYWGFVGAGGDPEDPAIVAIGSALELLQAFALFHDDVMDGSLTRRGSPTAHIAAEAEHNINGWSGEGRRYGESVAILAGDVSLVLSDVLLTDVSPDVRRLWNDLRIEVNLGQFLDVVGTARGNVALPTAERIVEYKTARYTIVRPLQMGAAAAGGVHLEEPLAAFGKPLGIAFQLKDDLLGVFGEASVTGKPVGDDLREAKPTPLLARARAAATPEQRVLLDQIGPSLTDAEVSAIQTILHDTGAVAEIEAQIDDLTAKALSAIEQTPLAGGADTQLAEIANFLASRTS